MMQLLLALLLVGLLIGIYLGGGKSTEEAPRGALETYHQAEDRVRAVESTMQERAGALERQLDEQEGH